MLAMGVFFAYFTEVDVTFFTVEDIGLVVSWTGILNRGMKRGEWLKVGLDGHRGFETTFTGDGYVICVFLLNLN